MTNKTSTTRSRSFLKGSALAAAMIAATTPAMAGKLPVSGSVEHFQSAEKDMSYQRGNFFYALPGNIKGYTFLEAYEDGSAFAKTSLTRKLSESVSALTLMRHINEGFSDAGIGLKYSVPFKENTNGKYASLAFTPFWANADGHRVRNRAILGFAVGMDIAPKVSIGTFAELNLNSKNGAEWGYGEAYAKYKVNDKVSVGYHPALRNNGKGKIIPRVEHRLVAEWRF